MKKITSLLIVIVLACAFAAGCGNNGTATDLFERKGSNTAIIDEIKAEEKNSIKSFKQSGATLDGVSIVTSDITANVKTEFKIDISDLESNPYDPSEVDVYGEFITPSDTLVTVPAFYTRDYDISLDAFDTSATYAVSNLTAIENASIIGLYDTKVEHGNPGVTRVIVNSGSVSGAFNATTSDAANRNYVYLVVRNAGDADTATFTIKLEGNSKTASCQVTLSDKEWTKVSLAFSTDTPDFTNPDSLALTEVTTVKLEGNATIHLQELGLEGRQGGNAARVLSLNKYEVNEFAQCIPGDNYNGFEQTAEDGDPYFCIRYNPRETGDYLYRVTFKHNEEIVATYTSDFTAAQNDSKGLVKVEPTLNRNFVFEDGTPYIPIGYNAGWYEMSSKKSYEYFDYFEKMNEAGMNWSRIWMSDTQFSMFSPAGGVMNFDPRLENAARLDSVIEKAEEENLYIAFVFLSHGTFLDTMGWPNSPFNEKNGGYIPSDNPVEFFTNERAISDFKKIIRYNVARWGYSQNIMCWELWNEVNYVPKYNSNKENSAAWHAEMARYIKGIDQMKHMVSTSLDQTYDIHYEIDELDFIGLHKYGAGYTENIALTQEKHYQDYKKPVFYAEFGLATTNNINNFASDPTGIHLEQGNWIGVMANGAGGAMTWWWEAVHARGLYYRYNSITEYLNLTSDLVAMPSLTSTDYTLSNAVLKAAGYKTADKSYVYIYHNQYSSTILPSDVSGATFSLKSMSAGTYNIKVFDIASAAVVSINNATATGSELTVSLPAISGHLALIIEKN